MKRVAATTAWSERHPYVIDLCLLAGAMLLLFSQALTNDHVFFAMDHMNGSFPAWREAAEALARGEFPSWTGAFFSGYPFFADSQVELFYPPALLFRLLLPSVLGYNLYLPFSLFFAAVNQYVLCRTLGTSRLAAIVAGLAFGAGFPLVNQVTTFSCVATFAWFPGAVAATLRLAQHPGIEGATLLAAIFGLQLLAGYFPFVAMTVLVCAIVLLGYRPTVRAVLWFAGAGVSALALAAIIFVPAVDLYLSSVRSNAPGFPYATSISPIQWLSLISPDHFGNPAEDTYWIAFDPWRFVAGTPYFGMAIPILFVIFLTTMKGRRDAVILACVIVCALFALGRYTPIYKLLTELPLFSKFRAPARWLLPFGSFLALGAALGIDRLLGAYRGKRSATRDDPLAAAGVLEKTRLSVLRVRLRWPFLRPPASLRSRHSRNEQFPDRLLGAPSPRILVGGVFLFLAMLLISAWAKGFPVPSLGPNEISPIQHERVQTLAHPRDLLFSITFGTVAIGILWAARRHRRFAVGLVPLLLLDLAVNGALQNPVAPISILDRPDNLASILPLDGRTFRDPRYVDPIHYAPEHRVAASSRAGWAFGIDPYLRSGETWAPGTAMRHRVEAIDGVSPYVSDRYRRLLRGEDFGSMPVFRPTPEVLDLLGVRYQAYPVRARAGAFPRAFFVEEWFSATDDDTEQAINKPGVDFRRRAFVSSGESGRDPRCGAATATRLGAFSYKTRSDAHCLLVITDHYVAGWDARVDGEQVPLMRTNLALRGVWVPAGEHRVDLEFHPATLRIGAAITATAWILLWVAAAWRKRRLYAGSSKESPTVRPEGKLVRHARWWLPLSFVLMCAAGAVDEPKLWKKSAAWLHYPSAAKEIALQFAFGLEKQGDIKNAERHRTAALRLR